MFYDDMEQNFWDDAEEKALCAYEMYELGDMPMALKHLEEAIEINPDNGAWHFNAGLTLDAMGRFQEAILSYNEALEHIPDDLEILNSLAVDYTRIGQYDLALSTFEYIQGLDPSFEPCYCNRIITYTEIDRHDLAEQMFYIAQQIEPDCPICFYNIGNSLFSRQDYGRAIWCWKRTAELDPEHPQINYRIAQAHWAAGNTALAREAFLEELRNNPGDTDVIRDFGLFLLQDGEIDKAREKFNRILESEPESALAIFYLGEIAYASGDVEQAREMYNLSIKKNPAFAGPRYRLGKIAYKNGENEIALAYLKTESELNIEDHNVLLAMGNMLIELGDLDYATDCFLRVIDEDNHNTEAFYGLGSALEIRGDIEGAAQFYEHILSIDPDAEDVRAELARLHIENNNLVLAEKTIRSGIFDGKSISILKPLARKLYWKKKFRKISLFLGDLPFYRVKMLYSGLKSKVLRPIRKKNSR